jgi:hypothetical protein
LAVLIEQGPAADRELRVDSFGVPRGELLLDQGPLAGRQRVRIDTGKSAAELLLDQGPLAGRQRAVRVAQPPVELVIEPMALRATCQTLFALEPHLDVSASGSNTDMANAPDATDSLF